MKKKPIQQSKPNPSKLANYAYYLSFLLSLNILACDDPSQANQVRDESQSCEIAPEQEACQEAILPAHSPDCIAVDGDLCLISFSSRLYQSRRSFPRLPDRTDSL